MTIAEHEKLMEIVGTNAGHDPDDLDLDTSLEIELNLDSLEQTQLMMDVEDAFDISINHVEWQKVLRIRDIANLIDKARGT